MTQESNARRAARLPHSRRASLAKGDPVPPAIVPAAIYNLPGDPTGFRSYGRSDNPTWDAVEHALGLLEDAPALGFPSGMAAITAAFLATLKAGDKVLLPSDGYYGARVLADRVLTRLGVSIEQRPTAQFADGGFEGFRVVYLETPSNPGLDIADIRAISDAAHAAGALVMVDNTTMTPLGQRPLDLGADLVVAADTKAPNGHSDTLFGHVASRDQALMQAVSDWRRISGSIPSPFDAWLVHRGLETLEVRFSRMCDSAQVIAESLRGHPALSALRYPGLPDDPSHNLASTQMERFGILLGLTLRSEEAAERFMAACPFIQPATSFGGVHTSAERRARWGDLVAPGFVRLSVGCEPMSELRDALLAALDEAEKMPAGL